MSFEAIDRVLTDFIAKYFPFANDHLDFELGSSITKIFAVVLVLVVVYEVMFKVLVSLEIWEDQSKRFFVDKPVHCAHVYCLVSFVIDGLLEDDYAGLKARHQVLRRPLKYHIEFGPDDYDFKEDEELGSTVGFLTRKLEEFVVDSSVVKPEDIIEARLYRRGELKDEKEKALCLAGIETGKTVEYIVSVRG